MKKDTFISTSIPYANANPHIGFAMEIIQADLVARYKRQKGHNVFFLTGTDEHGSKMWRTAQKQGIEIQEFVNEKAKKFKELTKILNISNDDFIRTTEKRHQQAAKKLWQKIAQNNFFKKKNFQGLYCSGCEAFLTEKDLIEGKCPYHKKAPEKLSEKNWFFLLSNLSEQILEILKTNRLEIFPFYRQKEIIQFVKKGLNDISFSRPKENLPWGIDVPSDNNQVMYVWCEALINYISALDYGKENQEKFIKFWQKGEKIQIIGKDILRFHAAFWPGMLQAANEELPSKILVHGFLTSSGEKMSKSLGNVIDPFDIVQKYDSDSLRFYLLHQIPFGRDGDFTEERFQEIRNAYLADSLGNLLSRVHQLALKANLENFMGIELKDNFALESQKMHSKVEKNMNKFEFHLALEAIFTFFTFLNRLLNETKPWQKLKEDPQKGKILLQYFLESLRQSSYLLAPFLPSTSEKIRYCLGLDKNFTWQGKLGTKIILFPKI